MKNNTIDNNSTAHKQLSYIYSLLYRDVVNNRWKYITKDNISFSYDTCSGLTEILVTFYDANNHLHRFTMNDIIEDETTNTQENNFELSYVFDMNSDDETSESRSFTTYLSPYLLHKGLDVAGFLAPYTEKNNENKYVVKYTTGLDIKCSKTEGDATLITLIDVTLSHLKPLSWFYTKEPEIFTIDEIFYFFAGVRSQLCLECCKERWLGVKPENFGLYQFSDKKESVIELTYSVDGVWKIAIGVTAIKYDDHNGFICYIICDINEQLSEAIKKNINELFTQFIGTLKLAEDNTYIRPERAEHYINIHYFHIEDTFDHLCTMLDEVIPALHNYNFLLPPCHNKLPKEIEKRINQIGIALNTTLAIITDEDEINNKFKRGSFLQLTNNCIQL